MGHAGPRNLLGHGEEPDLSSFPGGISTLKLGHKQDGEQVPALWLEQDSRRLVLLACELLMVRPVSKCRDNMLVGTRASCISSAEGQSGASLLFQASRDRQMFKPYIRAHCCPWLQAVLGSNPASEEVSRKAAGSFSRAAVLQETCEVPRARPGLIYTP